MSYQQYPASGSGGSPRQDPEAPPSIRTAVKLMYAGAALSALSFIIGLATIGSLRQAIINASAQQLTAAQIHAEEVFGVAFIVVLGLLGVGLWLWMAWENRRGRTWARLLAAVLFGFNTVGLLSAIIRPTAIGTKIFDILGWLVGLGATYYLWRPDASQYFARPRPQLVPVLPPEPPGMLPTYWPREERED